MAKSGREVGFCRQPSQADLFPWRGRTEISLINLPYGLSDLGQSLRQHICCIEFLGRVSDYCHCGRNCRQWAAPRDLLRRNPRYKSQQTPHETNARCHSGSTYYGNILQTILETIRRTQEMSWRSLIKANKGKFSLDQATDNTRTHGCKHEMPRETTSHCIGNWGSG